eukprot:1739897-Pyramimonas_sp.AAC.1
MCIRDRRCTGWEGDAHANAAAGAFGGAPYGATKRCTGQWQGIRALPLGPSVELPMGAEKS